MAYPSLAILQIFITGIMQVFHPVNLHDRQLRVKWKFVPFINLSKNKKLSFMNKKWLFLLLLSNGLIAAAQPKLRQKYCWQKLDNGLEVVVIENHKVPLATIEIAVKNGAYTEGPEYSGLSHLFEHMFFKANKDYPDQEKFIKRR